MNDGGIMPDVLEGRLRRWMNEQAPVSGDAPILEAVVVRTRGLGQLHGVRASLRRRIGPPRPLGRLAARPRMRIVLAVVLLLVALVGAVLVSTGTKPDLVQPALDLRIYPRLPADLPPDRSGNFETLIGPARWVHLVGDLDSWPVDFRPLPGPTGLLALDLGGHHPECEVVLEETEEFTKVEECPSPPGLWRSTDGLTWVREPLPVANASWLDLVNGTYWLRSDDDPTALRRSSDAVEWTEIDLSSLVPPKPAGLAWAMELGRAVASGDATVIPVGWTVRDAHRLLGLPDDHPTVLKQTAPGRFTIESLVDQSVLGSIEVAATASGLRILDATSRRLISELDGVRMDFMERWVANWGIVEQGLAVIDGTLATPVTLPGAPLYLPEEGFDGLHLFASEDGFRAFNRTPDQRLRVWHSADGRAWQEEDVVSVGDGPTTVSRVDLRQEPGREPGVILYTDDGAWESADGRTWQVATVDDQNGLAARRLPSGWLSTGYGRHHLRTDDGDWEPVLDPSVVAAANVSNGDRIGDTWFENKVSRVEGVPRQDLWIVQVDMGPAD